jgi:hypothetical protein
MVTRRTKPETRRSIPHPAAGGKRSRAAKAPAIPKRKQGEDLHDYLMRLGDSIPENERKKLPTDGAANHDHYIYGAPKQY